MQWLLICLDSHHVKNVLEIILLIIIILFILTTQNMFKLKGTRVYLSCSKFAIWHKFQDKVLCAGKLKPQSSQSA